MSQAALIPASSRAVSLAPALRGPASALSPNGEVESGAGKTFGQIFRAQTAVASVPAIPGTAAITTKSATASPAKEAATGEDESAKAEPDIAVGATDTVSGTDGEAKLGGARLDLMGSDVNPKPQSVLKFVRLMPADGVGASDAVQDKNVSGKGKSVESGNVGKSDTGKSGDEKKSENGEVGCKSRETASNAAQIQGMALAPVAVSVQAVVPVVVSAVILKAGVSARATENNPRTAQAGPIFGSTPSVVSGDVRQSEAATESLEKLAPARNATGPKEAPDGKNPVADGVSKASPAVTPALPGALLQGIVASGTTASGDGKAAQSMALAETRSAEGNAKAKGLTLPASTQVSAQPGAVAASAANPTSGPAIHLASTPAAAPISGAAAASVVSASPYARMDQMGQGAAPVVLHSGAQQVAVGVQDTSLGWVEIRTQNVSGHVDATLVAASGATQSALAAQLPAMAQFVAQHDVRLGSLAVQQATVGNFSGGLSGGAGFGNGAGQNNSGQSGGNLGNGFNPGGLMGGSGNPAGGPHPRSARSSSGFALGRSAGGIPAAGVPATPVSYGDGEDAALRPVSYISVRV